MHATPVSAAADPWHCTLCASPLTASGLWTEEGAVCTDCADEMTLDDILKLTACASVGELLVAFGFADHRLQSALGREGGDPID